MAPRTALYSHSDWLKLPGRSPGRGLPVSGRKSEDNPFIVGMKGMPLCFTVMPECAQASELRIGAK